MTDPTCEIHIQHRPKNLTAESHHVIPRAWQQVWHPETDQRVLWAPKTIELCPTGHRNVHQILVAVMKDIERHEAFSPKDADYLIAENQRTYATGRMKEFGVAIQAIHGWIERGGELDILFLHKQYGFGLSGTGFHIGGIVESRSLL